MLDLQNLLAGSPYENKIECLALHLAQVGITADNVGDMPGRVGRNICGCDVHSLTAFLVEKLKQPVVVEVQVTEPAEEAGPEVPAAAPVEEAAPEPSAESKRRSKHQ